MKRELDQLLTQYETGCLTRRQFVAALAVVAGANCAPVAAASAAPIGTIKSMNHVSIFVPDVKKAVAFYQDLFGMPLLTRQDPGVNLNAGAGFLGIYPNQAGATSGSINHLCFGMDNFDADTMLKALTERGIKGSIRMRGDTKELYFTDPDGVRVQLQDTKYIGGVGVLGDKPPSNQ